MATDQNTRGSTLDTLLMIYLTVIVMVVVGMKILLSTLTPRTGQGKKSIIKNGKILAYCILTLLGKL